ncbi:MAG: hypothetical protein WAO09_10960 [Candidatus Dormiibacterota bacterium]|jgi:hypothetical protein
MMEPEHEEREETVTTVGPAQSGQQTVTRTSSSVAPAGFRAKSLVWLAAGVVDAILALDFVFKIAGSADVGFVSFIWSIASHLSAPFRGVLTSTVSTGHYAYWPDIVGIVVYSIAAWIVAALIGIMAAPRPTRTDQPGGVA